MPRPMLCSLVLLLAATLAAVADADAAGPGGAIEVGHPLPDLVLPDATDGRPRSFAEFRGKRVLLLVFASW